MRSPVVTGWYWLNCCCVMLRFMADDDDDEVMLNEPHLQNEKLWRLRLYHPTLVMLKFSSATVEYSYVQVTTSTGGGNSTEYSIKFSLVYAVQSSDHTPSRSAVQVAQLLSLSNSSNPSSSYFPSNSASGATSGNIISAAVKCPIHERIRCREIDLLIVLSLSRWIDSIEISQSSMASMARGTLKARTLRLIVDVSRSVCH